jgi:hypothetical protein
MGFPVDIYFICISLFTAILIQFKKDTPLYLKSFLFFLLITIAVEICGWLLSNKNLNTVVLYNIFSTFEFVFYFWVLKEIIRNKTAKRIILLSLYLYPVSVFAEIFFWNKSNNFHATTYALGCLLVVAICIYYFFELFQLSHSVNLVCEPAFWICSGLLFFYSCSFPIYGFANFLNQLPAIILRNLEVILNIMNSLLYSSFTVAFLCRLKVRKSIL